MALANYENLLSYSKAKVEVERSSGLTTDIRLALRWTNLPKGVLEEAAEWEKANRVTITDLDSEYKEYSGTWRTTELLAEHTQKDGGVLTHRIAFGYITSLVTGGVLDWSEARLQDNKDLTAGTLATETGGNTPERYLTVVWPNVSPSSVNTIKASIDTLAASGFNPVIKGETLSTGFHRLFCQSRIEEDGSASIVLYLAQPEFALEGFADWATEEQTIMTYFWNVPKELAQTVMDAEKSKGRSVTPAYNKETVDIVSRIKSFNGILIAWRDSIDNASTGYSTMYLGVSDNSVYTIPSVSIPGHTYTRGIKSNKDGSFDIVVSDKVSNMETVIFSQETSSLEDGTEMVYKASPSVIVSPASSIGSVYVTSNSITDDSLYDGNLRLVYSKPASLSFSSDTAAINQGATELYQNWRTSLSAPASDTGYSYSVRQSINKDGSYDGSMVYQFSTAKSAEFSQTSSALEDDTEITYKASRSKIETPSSSIGSIYVVNNSINADATYDGEMRLVYSKPASFDYASERQVGNKGATLVYNNWRTGMSSPEAGVGIAYAVRQSINKDGSYDGSLSCDISTPESVTFLSANSTTSTEDTLLYQNNRTGITSPTSGSGFSYATRQSINKDGSYDGALVYQVSLPVSAKFVQNQSILEDDTEIVYKSSSSVIAAPSSSVGSIYVVSNSITSDSMYDGNMRLVYSKPASVDFTSEDSLLRKEGTLLYNNWRTSIASPSGSAGSIYIVRQSVNRDGSYDGSVECRISVPASAEFVQQNSILEDNKEIIYSSNSGVIVAPASSVGSIYVVSNSITEDSTYDGNLRLIYSKPASLSFVSENSAVSKEATLLYQNSRSSLEAPASVDSGFSYIVRQSINRDGSYDGSVIYQGALNPTQFSWRSTDATLGYEDSTSYLRRASSVTSPGDAQGLIYHVRNTVNRDGSYDADVTSSVSQAEKLYVTWTTHAGLAFDVIYNNTRTVPDMTVLPTTRDNLVQASINQDGTYDFVLRSRTPDSGGSGEDPWENKWWRWREITSTDGDGIYVETYMYLAKSPNTISAFMKDSADDDDYTTMNLPGSSVGWGGKNRWHCSRKRKVTSIEFSGADHST